MGKQLFIAEKPSVALEFARVLGISGRKQDGYVESDDSIVTWCVGHLVTMSYPEVYDPALKRWSLDAIPFIPTEWKYEVIESVAKQFKTVAGLLTRADVETIYICTDSGREGEYIYRLVRQMANVKGKSEKRVWIDSQTEEEIKRGIKEAKDISCYDALSSAAYLRAKEDYLMGINFSRALTLKFGPVIAQALKTDRAVVSVGRVMTCVLGMIVRREREIRSFVPAKFYRVVGTFDLDQSDLSAEWKAVQGSKYFESPYLYKENGFKTSEKAQELIDSLSNPLPAEFTVASLEKKMEQKKAPLLFNLAELQNECSKRFKKSPDETLNIIQELYEKKLVTYPRTDARVLSTAVAKEIYKNIQGLTRVPAVSQFANEILANKAYIGVEKSQYTDDSKITDHYAVIPTGQGLNQLQSLSPVNAQVYELICRRFLAIFYPNAKYEKISLNLEKNQEHFFTSYRFEKDPGFTKVWIASVKQKEDKKKSDEEDSEENDSNDQSLYQKLLALKKGSLIQCKQFEIKEGETSAPKRYTSGSIILAMENAGQLIEDEELRAQIKGSGIGTSATRAEILKKLQTIEYIKIHQKTQVVTPTLKGELIFDTVDASMKSLLNAELTASWEKGLSGVANGTISETEYMEKLSDFVTKRTQNVKAIQNPSQIRIRYEQVFQYYQ